MPVTLKQEKQIRAPGELANRYARAFYSYLKDKDMSERKATLEKVYAFQEALSSDSELQTFLDNPCILAQPSKKLASILASGLELGDDLRRLIGVVAREKRLSRLNEILEAVILLNEKEEGSVSVDVSTPQALTDSQRQDIRESLKKVGHQNISMTEHVDPSLIGGMTVRIGPILFDTSIAGRLTRLQHAMKGVA